MGLIVPIYPTIDLRKKLNRFCYYEKNIIICKTLLLFLDDQKSGFGEILTRRELFFGVDHQIPLTSDSLAS